MRAYAPMLSDMLLSRCSFGIPRPSDSDFLRSLLHHFQSGCALKWASFTYVQGRQTKKKQTTKGSYQPLARQNVLAAGESNKWSEKNPTDAHLEGQVVVLLLLVGTKGVPPLPQDLADCPIVLVGVSLVHQSSVAFAKDHERVHRAADVVFLPLGEGGLEKRAAHTFCSTSLILCTLILFRSVNWPSCLHPLVRRSATECASSLDQRRVPDRWPRPGRSWLRQTVDGRYAEAT